MKVYILTVEREMDGEFSISGIFDKPKTIRKLIDSTHAIKSKGKWIKVADDTRSFLAPNGDIYEIQEFNLIVDKNWDKDV